MFAESIFCAWLHMLTSASNFLFSALKKSDASSRVKVGSYHFPSSISNASRLKQRSELEISDEILAASFQ